MHRSLLAQLPYLKFRHSFLATPVTTGAWVQIMTTAQMLKACTAIEYRHTGNGVLRLSQGAAGLETTGTNEKPLYLLPGGSVILVPLELELGKPLTLLALDQDCDDGDLVINFYG
jgi:hypothetical protein